MATLSQVPSDYKKYFDQSIKEYLPSKKTFMDLYDVKVLPPDQVIHEYVRKTQTYSATKGWTSFDDPQLLPAGMRPSADDIGLESDTTSPSEWGQAYRINCDVLEGGTPVVRDYIQKFGMEKVEIVRNYVNRALISNAASNAGQTASVPFTWASGDGDPVADMIDLTTVFEVQSGGQPADFVAMHPYDAAYLPKDIRFQNMFYVNQKYLETAGLPAKPFSLDLVKDQAMTQGTIFVGKRGMFGRIYVTRNFATYESDEASAGKTFDIKHKWEDQYPLPYYLLKATGIN